MTISTPRLAQTMELKKKSPAFKNFMRGLNNKHTLSDYSRYNFDFMKFHSLGDNFDKLVKNKPKVISKLITDYLDHCKDRGVKNATLRSYLMGIERMFVMNDCIWHKDRIRAGIGTDEEIPGGKVPITTDELWQMIQHTKSIRTKCLVYFLADTGMRPGGLSDPPLRMKHLVAMKSPNGQKCYALKIYDNSKSGYWGFLTPETTKLLDSYFESRKSKGHTITDETPIFESERKVSNDSLTTEFARVTIANLIKSAGVKRIKINKHRYDKSVMYMFRKRFNTIMKLNNDVNSNIAEKLMNHKRGLDGTYLQPTRDECFNEFIKAIPELTISPTRRHEIQIIKQQEEITELQEKNLKIQELESKMGNMEKVVKKVEEEKVWNEEIAKIAADFRKENPEEVKRILKEEARKVYLESKK